ncbi:MAG: hypothetical protein Kow0013_22300 [Pararhodobacter sp.]
MSWMSLGSLALPHQLQRQGAALRNDIARLGQELTTGIVASPERHLKGAIGPLALIDAGVARNTAFTQSAHLAATRADTVQSALTGLDTLRQKTAETLLASATAGGSSANANTDGRVAAAAFNDAVSALGVTSGGVQVFSGTAADTPPLIGATDMLAALSPLVSGLSSAQEVADAITMAFTGPGGLFETGFYTGGGEARGGAISDARFADAMPTAADPAIRLTLAGLAMGAMLADPDLTLNAAQRTDLARRASEALMSAAPGVSALQARVGAAQSGLEQHITRLSTERDGLSVARQALIGADPYEAATRLQEAQTQLETLYTVTARTARLSLVEYL